MKAKIESALKGALMKAGKYAAFVGACERFEADGRSGNEALNAAIDEVAPELSRFKWRRRKAARAGRGSDARCNGYRLLEWVVENYDEEGVERGDAPSGAAWSVLNAAKADGDVYRDVLKKYLDSKIKLDAAQGDTDTRRLDGQAEYDILEGLSEREFGL